MFTRLQLVLTTEEFNVLRDMAQAECREPRQQLRYLLREVAQQRGLLSSIPLTEQTQEIGHAIRA